MAEVLKQALASLCSRSGWCYAVFWKLKRRSRMVLTWEDGYYEFAPVQMSANSALLTGSGRNLHDGTLEDQIQLAVAKMSFHVYSLGEGIIGRVAFTGKHQWIFANGERISESGPTVSEKFPDGWSNQFAAGIKTIAVVAVQQGVVQLGSTQLMTEDLNLVGQIRALFGTLQSVPGAFVSDFVPDVQLGRLAKNPTPAPRAAASTLTFVGRSSSLNNRSTRALEEQRPVKVADQPGMLYAAQPVPNGWASTNLMTFPSMEPRTAYDLQSSLFHGETGYSRNASVLQADNVSKRVKSPYDGMQQCAVPVPVGLTKPTQNTSTLARMDHSSANTGRAAAASACEFPASFGFKLPADNSSRQFDSVNLWSPCTSMQSSVFSTADLDTFGEDAGMVHSEEGFDYSTLFKAFQKDDLDDFNNLLASLSKDCAGSSASHFAVGDELSEALVPHQKAGPGDLIDSMLVIPSPEDIKFQKNSAPFELPSENVAVDKVSSASSFGDIFGGLSDNKPEQLLDAIVAGASSLPLCSGQFKSSSVDGPRPGPPPAAAAAAVGVSINPSPSPSPVPKKQPAVSSPSFDRDLWASSSVSLEVSSSSWTDRKSEDRKDSVTRKSDEPARSNGRKRLRPGEAPRPRPKDRQQIQDRVRELRDIVPNATKCSIDALLEKTIRHMKFLQSVTQHGDKWKTGGTDMSKTIDSSLESGASWAFEYDGNGSGVPILVENLKQPRQMLVEMLCEERGLFWEIAENIRGLGLTILKGVMESRNDKVWARFNVEGTKEVNRVKVLWNLSQLLKLNPKSCAVTGAASTSYSASEVITEVCSESVPRFQPTSHAIAVSPGWT